MEIAFFWTAWAIISFWVLKNFYFSYDKEKLAKLRQTGFGIDLSVIILFFLPWLPLSQGGFSGLALIFRGNLFVIALFILIAASALLFLTKDSKFLKVGAILHIIASILFIIAMISLMPKTLTLTLNSVAPIIASLLLLIGNVVVLLLWQQLQLKKKMN